MSEIPFWDFNESTNYKTIYIGEIPYKVLVKRNNVYLSDYIEAAELLYSIQIIIYMISHKLQQNLKLNKYSKEDQKGIKCFLSIHPNNYLLSEMQDDKLLSVKFNGLNKPKNVKYDNNVQPLGPDGKKRAEYRDVFLLLRDKKNNLLELEDLILLVIHEITHSACNHVTWRDDDHGEDFKRYERLIKQAYNDLRR